MKRDLARIAIEYVQPFAGSYPERPRPIFAARVDVVAGETGWIVDIVSVASHPPGRRDELVQAVSGGQPQRTNTIFADVIERKGEALRAGINPVVSEGLGSGIEPIQ